MTDEEYIAQAKDLIVLVLRSSEPDEPPDRQAKIDKFVTDTVKEWPKDKQEIFLLLSQFAQELAKNLSMKGPTNGKPDALRQMLPEGKPRRHALPSYDGGLANRDSDAVVPERLYPRLMLQLQNGV